MVGQQVRKSPRSSTLLWTTLTLFALILLIVAPSVNAQTPVTASAKGASLNQRAAGPAPLILSSDRSRRASHST